MKKWSVLIVLGCAQFVLVLDGTVMNVSISTVVADLDTTVTAMQAAITFYTLTMAALMLLGAKLGDVWGRRRAFVVGSVIYAIGSLITSLSPTFAFLFLGWSIVEGLGAVLVIPAVAALVADNYTGTDRVKAYATIGALSGAAVAAGPLIGGFLTTYASWRYVFAGEVVIMIVVLLFSRVVTDSTPREHVHIDLWSVLLSASGLVLAVFGMLQSKTWGWVRPAASPDIAGREITPLGISLTSWLILVGTFLLYAFVRRQGTLVRTGRPPLVHMEVLSIRVLRSGLTVLGAQYAITAGLFFMVPVYLQMTLGLDALATGTKIFPLSVSLILFSVVGTRLSARWSPRRIVRWGQSILVVSSLVLLGSVSIDLKSGLFAAGMFCAGAGLGLLASQLGNVNMSAVTEKQTSEVGGLQGVFQNLGSSLGTAVIGSVLIASLTTSFTGAVAASDLPSSAQSLVAASTQDGVPIVEASSVDTIAAQAGLTTAQGQTLTTLYTDSQLTSLRLALFALTVIGLLSLLFSRRIPGEAPPRRATARRSPPTDEAPQVRAQRG